MSFQVALSGLAAAQTDLDVTGNNIANVATTGFKQSRAEFSDIYATSIQDLGTQASGRGVRVARVSQQFSQGTVEFTSNNLDLAVNGEGFFVLEDSAGSRFYSRAGALSVDREGYIINHASQRLQAYPPITGSDAFDTGTVADLQLNLQPSAPETSTSISAGVNINASDTAPTVAFVAAAPTATMYNSASSITVYDTLGDAHTATMYFRKTAANTWDVYQSVDGGTADGPEEIVFDASGALVPASSGTAGVISFGPYTFTNGASPMTLGVDFNTATQYAGEFGVNDLSQDGYTSGQLNGIDVDDAGVVFARFTNGRSTSLGQVMLAKFNNPSGMGKEGGNNWTETFESGDAQIGEAGTSSFGSIQSGALELSNVDIATQLVKLIVAQRNFQANAKAITTSDQVTQAVINIR
ncbi:MAG: flagellar hook protein FlgE [Candidatus Sedimenticola sp. (ex Thyasira tokunagai)]